MNRPLDTLIAKFSSQTKEPYTYRASWNDMHRLYQLGVISQDTCEVTFHFEPDGVFDMTTRVHVNTDDVPKILEALG